MTATLSSKLGCLFIVATPIGNLRDITLRALEVLRQADIICCEDTRHASRLLQAHGITVPTMPYHEHNALLQRPVILEKLAAGKQVALISDAGTPLISDPGYRLVTEARQSGFMVTPIPGVSAAITALSAAGLPTDQFHFCGFLPSKTAARQQKLEQLAAVPGTLVFYESPRRLSEFLQDAATMLGQHREAVIARELTKAYEEFRQGNLAELTAYYEKAGAPKGEIVVLIGPVAQQAKPTPEEVEAMLRRALARHSVKEAAELVSRAAGMPKREVYQLALKIGP